MKKGFIKASRGGLYSDMPDHKPANTTPMKLGVNRKWTSIASIACVLHYVKPAGEGKESHTQFAALCKTLEHLLSLCVRARTGLIACVSMCVVMQVAYNVFDGEELILDSIRSIKPNVDYIAIVYQTVSIVVLPQPFLP